MKLVKHIQLKHLGTNNHTPSGLISGLIACPFLVIIPLAFFRSDKLLISNKLSMNSSINYV